MVESQPSKLLVAGSIPVSRSMISDVRSAQDEAASVFKLSMPPPSSVVRGKG